MKKHVRASIWGNYSDYDRNDGWTEEDIKLHKSIDWKARNYEEYPVKDDSFTSEVVLYGYDEPQYKKVKFIKYLRANPIYPPYYAPENRKPFDVRGYVGPMYDGNTHGNYKIHDRYETQEMYDILTSSVKLNRKAIKASVDPDVFYNIVNNAIGQIEDDFGIRVAGIRIGEKFAEFTMTNGKTKVGSRFVVDEDENPDLFDYLESGYDEEAVDMIVSEAVSQYKKDERRFGNVLSSKDIKSSYFGSEQDDLVFRGELDQVVNDILYYDRDLEIYDDSNFKVELLFVDYSVPHAKGDELPILCVPCRKIGESRFNGNGYVEADLGKSYYLDEDKYYAIASATNSCNVSMMTDVNSSSYDTNNLRTKVKSWYKREYKDDDLAEEIDPKVTFEDVYESFQTNDFYNVIGVNDSIIRGRVFMKLAELLGCSYDEVYYMWLN